MTARTPVEFVDENDQRVGNRVVLETSPTDGGTGQPLLTDDITGALATIPTVHHEVHEGETFRVWYVVPHASPIADNAEINIVLTTGSKYPHIVFEIGLGGDCEFYLYRSPTFNLDGTSFTPHNLKDLIGEETSTTAARINPTVTNDGSEIFAKFLPGGTGGNAIGTVVRRDTEDILRINTSYLVKLINRAGNAKQFSIVAQWYEEDVA